MSHPKLRTTVIAASVAALLGIAGCGGSSGGGSGSSGPKVVLLPRFTKTNLISDQAGVALLTDPNLVNPWGIAFSPTGPWWVANNNSNLAGIYSGGQVSTGVITNNSPTGIGIPFNNPTGQVFNSTSDFQITTGTTTAKSLFIFASETGWIDAWNGNAGASAVAKAVVAGAVYKGLALGTNSTGNFLYATNFSAGTIDVFDKNFTKTTLTGNFSDPGIPAGFAPFGIKNLGGTLYVSYAKQDAAKHDDVPGPGNGFIDTFDTDGNFMARIISQGFLNSPWGMTFAPMTFGSLGNMLLVGNFGDGSINVYSVVGSVSTYQGTLADASGVAINLPGLWDLTFGNGGSAGDTSSLYFSSGPGGESHGLFGRINAPATPSIKKTGR